MIYADIFVDLGAGTADTTVPTAVNMAANTHGTYNTYTMVSSAGGMTIESPTHLRRYDTVCIPGYAFGPNYASKALKYLHTTSNLTSVELDLIESANRSQGTFFGELTIGPANAGASSALFDLLVVYSGWQSIFTAVQLNNGNGVSPGDYYLCLETNPGGVTTKTGNIRVTPGGTYWFNLYVDYNLAPGRTANTTAATGGCAKLALFHPHTGQLLGQITAPLLKRAATADKCDTLNRIRIGNNETGTSSGAISYFKYIGLDTTRAQFPILPRKITPMSQLLPQIMATVAAAGGGATAGYGGWQGGVVSVGF